MDHLGGSKPVPKGLRDLGNGFLLGGRHDPGFRDAQGLGHISMCGFRSDDDRIVHRIDRPREGCKMVAVDLIPVHRPAVPELYVTLSTVTCSVPAATGEKPQPSTWFGQRPSRSRGRQASRRVPAPVSGRRRGSRGQWISGVLHELDRTSAGLNDARATPLRSVDSPPYDGVRVSCKAGKPSPCAVPIARRAQVEGAHPGDAERRAALPASPGRAAYQRTRPRSIRPCSARSGRLSRRSPSRPSSNAGPSRKRAPSR